MKIAVLALIFISFVVAVSTESCWTGDECPPTKCCIRSGLLGFRKGDCQPLAKDGDPCNDEDYHDFNRRYVIHCPCESGLTCKPEYEKDLGIFGKLKFNERCTSEPGTREPEPETDTPIDETTAPEEETTAPEEETTAPEEE